MADVRRGEGAPPPEGPPDGRTSGTPAWARARLSAPAARAEVVFVALACVVGLGTGVVASTFRLTLEAVSEGRTLLIAWGHGREALGFLAVVAVATLGTAAAAWLVHRIEPHAEGSGIPRVEGIVEGRIAPGRPRILAVKFVGGLLAIGSGLALGREGPSVQMGAGVATMVANASRRSDEDLRALIAAGAGAGLTTAFMSPIAGSVFILEELVKRFDHRMTLAALVASGSGFAVGRVFIGPGTDFTAPALAAPKLTQIPIVAAVGLVTGLVGVAYNHAVMRCLRIVDTSRVPVVVRAAGIGACVGVVAWFAPDLVGSGNGLTQSALLGRGTIVGLAVVIGARFVLGAVSYAAATPGGLFAPTLVLGSNLGLLVGILAHDRWPTFAPEPAALALIGMASLFAATVRAPVTGIVLATEMTGSATLLAPMLGASALAMLVAILLRSDPIYDRLTDRSVRMHQANVAEEIVEDSGRGR